MKKEKKYFIIALSGWLVVGLLTMGYVIKAWSGATANPPASNTAAPINSGSAAQEKSGAFTTASIINNGTALFKGISTYTPTANNANFFNITNAAGTKIFTIDTTNSRVGVNVASPTVAFDITGGVTASGAISGNSLVGGACTVTSIGGPAGSFTWGGNMTSATGNIEATGGYVKAHEMCIGASCITAWPTAGSSVPETAMVLSDTPNNTTIIAGGYLEQVGWGIPYTINGAPAGNLSVYKKLP